MSLAVINLWTVPPYNSGNTGIPAGTNISSKWVDISDYVKVIAVIAGTDAPGTLYLEQSNDQATVINANSIAYTSLEQITANTVAKYARVRAVTGSSVTNAGVLSLDGVAASFQNMGNADATTLTGELFDTGGAVFNVKAYGAKGDGVTDDTAAIQATVTAAVAVNGTTYFPPGTYLVSSSLTGLTGGELVMAEGAVLKGASTFSGSGNRGIIELTNATDLIIRNLHTDLTATTDAAVTSLHQLSGSIVRTKILGVTQDCGGTAQHGGIMFEGLGQGAAPSRDLIIRDISTHNGNGDVMLYANANVTGLSYSQVTIENSISYIDENGIGDDRILVAANTPSSSLKGEVRDVLVRNVQVQIASTVTSGLVNGVKFDAGVNSYLHDWDTDGIFYQNESSTTLGAPINVYTGGNSNQENFNIKNVWANNISACLVQCARLNSDPTYRFENLKLLNNNSTVGALVIYLATGPSGDEVFTFKNCVMNGTLSGGSYTTYGPVGILLTGSTTTGASGNVVIDNCFIDGFNTPISSIVNENGTEQTSGWTNIRVERSKWINCSRNPMFSNTYKLSDNPGFNPTGPQTAPTVPASGTALTNPFPFDAMVYISGGTVTAIEVGGTATGIISGGVLVPAGETITLTYSAAPTWVWIGN